MVEGGFVGSGGEPVKEDTICGLNIRSGILYLSPPTSTCWPSGSSYGIVGIVASSESSKTCFKQPQTQNHVHIYVRVCTQREGREGGKKKACGVFRAHREHSYHFESQTLSDVWHTDSFKSLIMLRICHSRNETAVLGNGVYKTSYSPGETAFLLNEYLGLTSIPSFFKML